MQEISIELTIAHRKYPLRISALEAESAQGAAELINQKIKAFGEQYGVRDTQDLLAMTALQLATQLIDQEKQSRDYLSRMESQRAQLIAAIDEATR